MHGADVMPLHAPCTAGRYVATALCIKICQLIPMSRCPADAHKVIEWLSHGPQAQSAACDGLWAHQLSGGAAEHDLLGSECNQIGDMPRKLQEHAYDAHDAPGNAQLDISDGH